MKAAELQERILADLEAETFEEGHTREVATHYGASLAQARKVLKALADKGKLTWQAPESQGGDGGRRGQSPDHYFWACPW